MKEFLWRLWKEKIKWDEPLPAELVTVWTIIARTWKLDAVKISRQSTVPNFKTFISETISTTLVLASRRVFISYPSIPLFLTYADGLLDTETICVILVLNLPTCFYFVLFGPFVFLHNLPLIHTPLFQVSDYDSDGSL